MKDFPAPNPINQTNSAYGFKPFIKNITIQPVGNDRRKTSTDPNNKTFFSNIKAELNSIRTDVNKLVSKQAPRPLNGNKSYTGSSALKSEQLTFEPINDKPAQKRIQVDGQKLHNSSNLALETKISQLTGKLNQQVSKNQQIQHQFDEQRKNQFYLRDQIASLREAQIKLEQQLHNKNKEIDNYKGLYQRAQRQKQQAIQRADKFQFEAKKNVVKTQPITTIVEDPAQKHKIIEQQSRIQKLAEQLKRAREQINILMQKINNYDKEKQIQIVGITRNFEQKINRTESKTFKQLGASFEVKINALLDENYNLKNKITSLQSQIEHERVQIESLTSTVEAYEARDREAGRGINQIELQNLRNKIMELKEQNDKLQSQHQFEIMKLENKIDQLKANGDNKNDNKSFNQILKDQINEIENLKQKLRDRNETINKLKR